MLCKLVHVVSTGYYIYFKTSAFDSFDRSEHVTGGLYGTLQQPCLDRKAFVSLTYRLIALQTAA